MDWNCLADRTLQGHDVSSDEALAILRAPGDELLPLLQATAGHHLRSGARLGDEGQSDAGPGRAVLHAGQPIAVGTNVFEVEANTVIGHDEPDCSSILKGELRLDPRSAAVAGGVGQRLARDTGQGRLDRRGKQHRVAGNGKVQGTLKCRRPLSTKSRSARAKPAAGALG
jgi:hypothetical protein